MDSASVTAIASSAALIAGSAGTWLLARRSSSGRIGTSEAAVLWEQAQAMRAELAAQRDKAAEQRDRLIDAQAAQVIPALAAIAASLREITGSLARLEQRDVGSETAAAE